MVILIPAVGMLKNENNGISTLKMQTCDKTDAHHIHVVHTCAELQISNILRHYRLNFSKP